MLSTVTVVYDTGATQTFSGDYDLMDRTFATFIARPDVLFALFKDHTDTYVGNQYFRDHGK